MLWWQERGSGRLLHDLNIIEVHVFSCAIVCLASPTEDHLGLFPLGDRLNVGCRLGCDANPAELHEAYQQHKGMPAAIGQPSETLPSCADAGKHKKLAWTSNQSVTAVWQER